eukprot:gene132-3523_t
MSNKKYSLRLVEGQIRRYVCPDVSTHRLNDKKFWVYVYSMLPPIDGTREEKPEDWYTLILLGQYLEKRYRETIQLMRQDKFSFRTIPVSKLRNDKITDALGPIIGFLIDKYVIPKQDINVAITQLRQDYNNYASHNGWKQVDAARFGQKVSKFLKRRRLGTKLKRIYHYESAWQEFEQKIEKEGGKINRESYDLSDDEIPDITYYDDVVKLENENEEEINRDLEELEVTEEINRQKAEVAKRKPVIIIKCNKDNTLEIKENVDDVEQKKERNTFKREDEYEEIDEDEEYVTLDAKNIDKIHEDLNGKEALKKSKEFDPEKISSELNGPVNRGKQNILVNEEFPGKYEMMVTVKTPFNWQSGKFAPTDHQYIYIYSLDIYDKLKEEYKKYLDGGL